ncbi:MAG: 4-(cytidine 5'-diphospho)-2-C-methyl-D-erythritol kinase [Phycisphaerales bacterium]|nr:4-(cytidine 5'-diphospho)-2-C-methyl-D-erythritol kinase [Phycisphaerales bacterium]
MPNSRTIQTHAKINLILKVAPPNEQGLHPIRSWMHPIDLSDRLSVTQTDSATSFTVQWDTGAPVDWPIESDLIYKAHQAMQSHLDRSLPIHAQLTKSIPAGGGLGGGSSNAAGMLLLLNDLFDLKLSEPELQSIAHSIGTDIPFFLDLEMHRSGRPPRPAIVSGVGDSIQRIQPAESELTLLVPPFGCPTGPVYRAFDRLLPSETERSVQDQDLDSIAHKAVIDDTDLSNDLMIPATIEVPELATLLNTLRRLELPAHLSGSGSTLFMLGPLSDQTHSTLSTHLPDLKIIQTRLID